MGMDMPPAPPMGPDPMAGGEDPMGDPGMGDPMAGGDEGMPPAPPAGGDDDELTQVIDGLSMEDKAAVLKYAKSMADDNGGGEEQAPAPMPNESRMVRTTMREMMKSVALPPEDRKTERKEEKLSGKFGKKNPFVSPY